MKSSFLVLDEDIVLGICPVDVNWSGGDQDWFYIHNGMWVITKGTMWDGASLVPDGDESSDKPGYPITWKASLVHDLGYMFMEEEDFPYTRKEIDELFLLFLNEAKFKHATLYYLGVRHFGGIWNALGRCYRNVFNVERQFPTHLSVYEATEVRYA